MLDQRLAASQDPSIHDVLGLSGVRVVQEFLAVSTLVKISLTDEKSQTVDPSPDYGVPDVPDSLVLED